MATHYALLGALVILQGADIWSTWRVLAAGGRELNPVVAEFIARLGLLPGLVAVKLPPTLAAVAATYYGLLPWWLLAGLCALYVGVVANNLRALRRMRGG